VGAELFHADTRTDIGKLTVAFRNFVNTPKTVYKTYQQTSFFTAQKNVYNPNEDLGVCVPRVLWQQLLLNPFHHCHNCVYHLHFVHTLHSWDSHNKQQMTARTALIFVMKTILLWINCMWFQASAAGISWDVTQRRLVVSYQRFAKPSSPNFKRLLTMLNSWRWHQWVVPKRRQLTTNQRCITSQKSDNLEF